MLTLEEKIGQMMVVGFHGLEAPDYLLQWLAEGRVGGVILFARNVENPAQVAALTSSLHTAARHPLLIAIDQEGGVVARLREGFTESPGAMALGAADSEPLAEQASEVLGKEMHALGINWNLAPAIDLTHNIHNPSVGVRSLGVNPQRVRALAVAQVRGFQQAGVAATAKHFPGKAATPVDPHVSLPVIDGPLDDMRDTDLVPFQAVIDAGIASMMITHVQFRAIDPHYPSTLSSAIIEGLLRAELGFTGVASTDCMEMGAITNAYGAGESAVLAALAGADTILFSHTRQYQEEAYTALLAAARSGRLSAQRIDSANTRIAAMKARYAITAPPAPDFVRHPEHLAIMARIARAGMVQIKAEPDVLPLHTNDPRRIVLVEFASFLDSVAVEQSGDTGFAAALRANCPRLESIGLKPDAPDPQSITRAHQLTDQADIVIVATRSAHLVPDQAQLAQDFLKEGLASVLVCLRNPYDAGILEAQTIMCTCGDSAPSLKAAVEALMGEYTPAGKLPVPLAMPTT